jgi:hypothetical protein
LKGGEAETYQNVEIEYIHGRKAVLTIFHDGEEQEKIDISNLKKLRTREDLHALFLEKGFVLKSEEEIEAFRQQGEIDERAAQYKKEANLAQFEEMAARQIQELEAERDGTNDPDEKRKLTEAIEERSQQMENRREETRKRGEEIKKKFQYAQQEAKKTENFSKELQPDRSEL